jgi:hypothetical protein
VNTSSLISHLVPTHHAGKGIGSCPPSLSKNVNQQWVDFAVNQSVASDHRWNEVEMVESTLKHQTSEIANYIHLIGQAKWIK